MSRQPIIGFVGDMGSGKTLLMSIFAKKLSDIRGVTIYSNYGLKLPNTRKMDKEFLKSFFNKDGDAFKKLYKIFLLIDEFPAFIDSYSQTSKANRIFSKFVLQSRKRSVTIMYTAQTVNLITKRMRQMTNLIIFPVYDKNTDILNWKVYKSENELLTFLHELNLKQASRYFNIYDTEETIDILDEI